MKKESSLVVIWNAFGSFQIWEARKREIGEVKTESSERERIEEDREVIYGKCKGGNEEITDLIPLITVSSGDTWEPPPNL